ncbi:hypothetical protein BGW38_006944 [Lunasporangiospora selenospora]|uniref:Zn(2)-C6 fungal-type domain-containing protein n=1 Tax=Lunasporangiospora selenospora TaxID=979761 RepID=A0A9P6G3C5_9FUNG|nr:hypothetical protein BGW38_006944 [Lunasporangiospora selenospora]
MADSAPPSIGIALPPTSVLKIRDACLPCRKQRSKCDGQPCCSRCARLELECTYVELVKAPTPAPKEPWQEFLATTGTKPETFETLASELFNDPAVVPVSDTTTFPWQKPKVARRRKQTSSVRCTCPVTSTPTSMSSPMSMSMSSPDPAGQDSLLQSPLAQDVPDPFTKSPDPQSAPFYSTNSNAAPAAELGQSGTNSKRKGRSTSGPCRVHQPHLFSKPPRSAAQIGPSTVSTGASSSTSSMDGHGGAGPSGAPAGLLPSGHRHRPPPTEPAPLPTAVIETSEKINNLSSKLSRLFLFPDNSVPPPPPQLAILQSRSLSPVLQSHLIQLYLTYCWPTQPILDPHTFMARLAAQEYCTPPHPLLIAAMCAAAARCIDDTDIEALWEEHDLPNPIYPSYANGEPRVRSARDMICSIGEYFGSLAKGYLRTELPLVQSPDRSGGAGDPLTVVQGLIMISTWDASIGRQRECQACSALALRIMIAGGWHLMDHPNGDGCTDSRIKMWGTLERELARRCWWFVWVAEKWTAAILTQYVTLHLSLCETLSLPREFRQGDPNDNLTVRYFPQTIQGAYLCGAVIQLHYHPYEAEDGTEYHHEISLEDYKRLEARLNEIDTHLEAWFKALPGDLRPDWGEGAGEDSGDGQGFKPGGSSQFFVAGGEWWWRHYVGSLLELNYYALKLLLHHPPHVVSKIPSPVSRLKLAQMANKITLTCERLWQYPTTRPVFYHMAGPILWLALCYQQENTLSENPRIRTPACVNMQKSYYLVKKAGRLVHANEDEPLTELESVSGNSTTV